MDYFYKLCFLGDAGVGKTTLVQRYMTGSFSANTILTLGVNYSVKVLILGSERITLQIWDFGGEERFRFLLPSYCLGASGAIFVYDITSPRSLLDIGEWLKLLEKTAGKVPVLLVGTKSDLVGRRRISPHEAMEIGKCYGVTDFLETSAKTGDNVKVVFEKISRIIMMKSPH